MTKLSIRTLSFGVAALHLAACAESVDRPTRGGTGGSGADTGNGGSGATTNNGGGSSGPPPCTGCVEIALTITGPGQGAMFDFNFGTTLVDMSNAVVTWRVRTLNENDQFQVTPFAQNDMALNYAGA